MSLIEFHKVKRFTKNTKQAELLSVAKSTLKVVCDLACKLPTFGLNFHLKSGFDLQILLFTFIRIKVIHFVKDKIMRLGADTESTL